jgi:hypothetical protein
MNVQSRRTNGMMASTTGKILIVTASESANDAAAMRFST